MCFENYVVREQVNQKDLDKDSEQQVSIIKGGNINQNSYKNLKRNWLRKGSLNKTLMPRLDQFTWHSVHVMIYIISILTRNSGEIFVNFQGGDSKIWYLFSFLEFSSTMIIGIHVLNWTTFLYGLGKILIFNQPTAIIQFMTTILLPIHIWLSSEYIDIQKSLSSGNSNLWGIINLILAGIVLVITPRFINWHFNFYHLKVANGIGFVYDTLLGIDFVLQAVGGCAGVNYSVLIWVIAVVKLLRVVVYFTRINYADPIIQYCALLGQLTSAVGLISTFFSFYYSMDVTPLIWLNTIFFIYLCYQKPPILIQILEFKYQLAMNPVKQMVIQQINSGQNNFNLIPLKKLREVISIFMGMINHDYFYSHSWLMVRFSPKFINDALCLRQLIEYAQSQQSIDHSRRISFDLTQTSINAGNIMAISMAEQHNDEKKSNKGNDIIGISKENDIELNEAKRRQQWSKLWRMIQGLRQVKHQGYEQMRNYLIYAFPLYDIRSINKVMYLHYLNISTSTEDGLPHQPSFLDKIQQQIAYKYLTQRVFEEYQIEIDKENQFQSDKTKKLQHFGHQNTQKLKDYQNCDFFIHNKTNDPKPLQTSKFDLFYRQLLTQNLIQDLFTNIFTISRRILQLTNRPQRNSQVLQLLLEKSALRKEIKQKLEGIQNLSKLKSIVYKFLLQYYVNNTPHIAINNMNERQFQDYLLSGEENKLQTNMNKQSSLADSISDGKMILFVSGMRSLGRIVKYCGNFKQKMELADGVGKHQQENLQKLSISDIMLPIWTKQHRKVTKQSKKYDIPLHSNKKLFIQSIGSKHIMEISFQLHYILRKSDDLIYSLQISFKQVDKLLVYKGDKMVFESFRRMKEERNIGSGNKIKRRSFVQSKSNLDAYTKSVQKYFGQEHTMYVQYSKEGRTSMKPKRSTIIKKVPTIHQKCIYNNDSKGQMMHLALPNMHKEVRIEQSVDSRQSEKQKKKNSQCLGSYLYQSQGNDTSVGSTHSSAESIPNSNDISLGKYNSVLKESNNNRGQTNQHRQKLLREIKIKQYGKSTLFHQGKLWIFTLIHWQIPPIILIVSLIIRWYSIHQTNTNTTTYDLKLLLQNNFMIAQTQLVNSLMYMDQLASNYGIVNERDDGDLQMARLMVEDVRDVMGMIEDRQKTLHDKLEGGAVDIQLVDILFNVVSSSTTTNGTYNNTKSFYLTALEYEILAKQYLYQVRITQALQEQITVDTINTILNSINQLNNHISNPVRNFLNTFQNRYQNYVTSSNNNNLSLLNQIQLYEDQVYTFSQTFLIYFLIVISTVAFIAAIVFIYVYVDLQFSVQKLVLQAITFPKQQFKKINSTLIQAKLILENAKQYIPNKIFTFYDHFQSNPYAWQPKSKMISRNQTPSSAKFISHSSLIRTHAGVRSGLYDMKHKVYRSKWEVFKVYFGQILVFCVMVGICQYLLISFMRCAISETQTLSSFSSGTEELTTITAMSNQISISMGMGMQQLDKQSIDIFFQKLNEYQSTDKLDAFSKIQLTQKSYIEHTFQPVCDMFSNSQKPPQCQLTSTQLSFSQCISSNLKLFKFIGTYLDPPPQSSPFQPLTTNFQQLHRQLSLINLFTFKMMDLNVQTYQKDISEPIVYLQLLIIEMGVIILVFNWYTATKLYGKMKVLYDEMFCSCQAQDMIKMEQYELFINQSKHQKVTYVSGEYVE